nr:MAG TPA: hypothetical protein [Caudoviricetes sp.]
MTNTNNTNANTSILEDPFWKEAFAELDKSFAFDHDKHKQYKRKH